jgi:imidazoleglycerol-phosphate dehydratase/histidinol-phosphatase
MKKALFIDRDGTLIREPHDDFQVDSLEKLEFMPGVFRNLFNIRINLDYELVIVSNQDGLGTQAYPEKDFKLVQDKMLKAFENEGITFDDILIDKSFPSDNSPDRKPRTGLLTKYIQGEYDLKNCFVIGDRKTDVELAKNLGTKAIFYSPGADSITKNG